MREYKGSDVGIPTQRTGAKMPEQVLEGTWEEIALFGERLSGRRVRLTILEEELPTSNGSESGATGTAAQGAMIRRGMFPELRGLTDDDFQSAEWRGEELDCS